MFSEKQAPFSPSPAILEEFLQPNANVQSFIELAIVGAIGSILWQPISQSWNQPKQKRFNSQNIISLFYLFFFIIIIPINLSPPSTPYKYNNSSDFIIYCNPT